MLRLKWLQCVGVFCLFLLYAVIDFVSCSLIEVLGKFVLDA